LFAPTSKTWRSCLAVPPLADECQVVALETKKRFDNRRLSRLSTLIAFSDPEARDGGTCILVSIMGEFCNQNFEARDKYFQAGSTYCVVQSTILCTNTCGSELENASVLSLPLHFSSKLANAFTCCLMALPGAVKQAVPLNEPVTCPRRASKYYACILI
jgi:hypothetical protein